MNCKQRGKASEYTYLLLTEFEVRTVSYGSSLKLFPLDL